MPLLTRVAGAATRRMARGVGTVGVLHLRKEPRRAAYTVALVMVVLSMVFTAGAVHLSLRRNLVNTLSQRFPADLVVNAGATFDDALRERVRSTPGVRAATDLRFTRLLVERPASGFAFVTVVDPATFFRVQSIPWSEGSDRATQAAFRRGGAVAIPASMALRDGVHRDDRIRLATPGGSRTFRVAGVYKTFDSRPVILASAADAKALLDNATAVGAMAVAVESGTSPEVVKRAIERRFAGASPVFAALTSEQKAEFIEGQTAFFNIVYVFVLIAAVMGMLGVTNTLAMAVLRRNREIGILRAVGTERRQLRRMATVEAATIGLAGLALSIPLGLLLSVTVLRTVTDAIGIVVQYAFPWAMFAVVAVLAVVVAIVSSIVPGRHAARVDPARVLRFG
jgi:putative ABC transport system permease protein